MHCSDCLLMRFVPAESRGEKFPCRHIHLNEAGETIESFYRTGTQPELETAYGTWLRQTIQKLELGRAVAGPQCGCQPEAKTHVAVGRKHPHCSSRGNGGHGCNHCA